MLCTLSTAFTKLSISGPRQASRDPYFSLATSVSEPPCTGECPCLSHSADCSVLESLIQFVPPISGPFSAVCTYLPIKL